MCGIAGFISNNLSEPEATINCMINSIKHRGPDGVRTILYKYKNTDIGLGHSRLSIIDLSTNATQPMIYKHFTVVFNGEIYNYKEIRDNLMSFGRTFDTNSDTEVLLQSIDQWGLNAVHKFEGMFSFALLDQLNYKFYLCRDRVGVKPLFYYHDKDIFLFSSEIKSFFQIPLYNKIINFSSLKIYFKKGYISGDTTIYENTFKVKPGHYIEYSLDSNQKTEKNYWNILNYYQAPKIQVSLIDAIENVENLLIKSCKYRMVSDVPVGIFLSGGYDSTTVTSVLQKHTNQQLKTFTIGFENSVYDESKFAKKIANYIETDHNEYIFSILDLKKFIFTMYETIDEPFADASILPTLLLSKFAKESVTVALSSDGGDELFAGYSKYSYLLNYEIINKIPKNFRKFITNLIKDINPQEIPLLSKTYNFNTRYSKLLNLINSSSLLDAYDSIGNVFTNDEIHSLFIDNNIDDLVLPELININNNLDKLLYLDFNSYLVDDVLVKVDRSTMAYGLEGREPLLDSKLIEYLSMLPSHYKINNGEKKYILKNICHKYVPKTLMDRKKMGFGIPIVEWFNEDISIIIDTYLNESYIRKQNIFNFKFIDSIIKNYYTNNSNNTFKIWTLISFQLWYDKWQK